MTLIDALKKEFTHEAATTRRFLERVPTDHLGWRPHEKSFTAGHLAGHIVECVYWTSSIFTADELDLDPRTMPSFNTGSIAALLETFDETVAKSKQVLADMPDADVMKPWQFKIMGRVRLELPKAVAFRDFTLSHLIHHRGQLSVYLRLLDVPVPGAYGPTADDKF